MAFGARYSRNSEESVLQEKKEGTFGRATFDRNTFPICRVIATKEILALISSSIEFPKIFEFDVVSGIFGRRTKDRVSKFIDPPESLKNMKIAVIGAGSAGLAALRHCVSDAYNTEVICYEKTDQVGGTWVYREETGVDRYGLPIHTSMYENLR